MTSSAVLKPLVAALLVLSLAGKVAATRPAPEADAAATVASVAAALRAEGFRTRAVTSTRSPFVFVLAERGACRILAGDYPPHGTFAAVYRSLAVPIGRLHYVHRGTVADAAPRVRGLFDFYLWRELRRIGVAARRAPVVAVAAGDACRPESIDWRPASSLPA